MSKSLKSFSKSDRKAVVNRRLKNAAGGIGTWAAIDYVKRLAEQGEAKEETQEQPAAG